VKNELIPSNWEEFTKLKEDHSKLLQECSKLKDEISELQKKNQRLTEVFLQWKYYF
jgi:FtsZ-binding cell division protein ZapB